MDLYILAETTECECEITHILLRSADDTRIVRYEEYAIESSSQLSQTTYPVIIRKI
jgi:hypothetical protein